MQKVDYIVVGSGMQGTAAGYDLARLGHASRVFMADRDSARAQAAAHRINELVGSEIAEAKVLDASQSTALDAAFAGVKGVFSAASYKLNKQITEAAIKAGAHMVDLGGNTDVVRDQLRLNGKAKAANLTIIPDCGLAPGLGNTLASYGISLLDQCESVEIRCGGLPQKPRSPLDYKLVFSIEGLTNEYFGKAWCLRDSKVTEVETFSELEELEFPHPIGRVEAFVTTGGSSTCPWTYEGRVKSYDYKTVRYRGHFEKMKCIMDLGLLDLNPVQINGHSIVPRDVFHQVAAPRLSFEEDRDLVVLRTICRGHKDGKPKTFGFELIDTFDEKTGFTAMERTTAYPAALCLILSVRGLNAKGVVSLETGLNNEIFMREIAEHDLPIRRFEA